MCLTPEGDLVSEDMDPLSDDVLSVKEFSWVLGRGLPRVQVHRFSRPPSATRLKGLVPEAKAEIERLGLEWCEDGGAGEVPMLPLAAVAAVGGVPRRWLVILDLKGNTGGQLMAAEVATRGVITDKVITVQHDGGCIIGKEVNADEEAECVEKLTATWGKAAAPNFEDARVLPIARDTLNERYRSFRDSAGIMSAQEFVDFPIKGPRTTLWLVSEFAKAGLNPVARHSQWRVEWGLQGDDRRVRSHEQLSELFELLVTYDQLDASNLVTAEALARYLQQIEYDVKKAADAKVGDDQSAFTYFNGRQRRTASAFVCPALTEHIARIASQDAAILKETRKAAEERGLARAKK